MSDSRIEIESRNSDLETAINFSGLDHTETVKVTDTETGNSSTRTGSSQEEATERAAEDVRAMNRASGD